MTITIRNHRTGEALRSWNQPGSKDDVIALAHQYAIRKTDVVLYSKGRVEVWTLAS